MSEFTKLPPNRERALPVPILVKMLGHLAVHAYEHSPLLQKEHPLPHFAVVEHELTLSPQPLQPDIFTAINEIREMLNNRSIQPFETLSLHDKITKSARMVQFTDRLMSSGYEFIDYTSIKGLKDSFMALTEKQSYPLSFTQQLDQALELSSNDMSSALTLLWLASRQYARWLDTVSIHNLPDMTPEEIRNEIREWRSTLLAYKMPDENNFQDPAGDTYYMVTHVRAAMIYGNKSGFIDKVGKLLFQYGTAINTVRIIPQTIASDHRPAANYGNQLGDAILEMIRQR